jgi:hypothetical protein
MDWNHEQKKLNNGKGQGKTFTWLFQKLLQNGNYFGAPYECVLITRRPIQLVILFPKKTTG